jgi:hypothetical protein
LIQANPLGQILRAQEKNFRIVEETNCLDSDQQGQPDQNGDAHGELRLPTRKGAPGPIVWIPVLQNRLFLNAKNRKEPSQSLSGHHRIR